VSACHQGAPGRVLGCACGPHLPAAFLLDGPRPWAPDRRGRWTQERRWQQGQPGSSCQPHRTAERLGSES